MGRIITKLEDADVEEMLDEAKSRFHQELCNNDVTVGLLKAERKKRKDGTWTDGPVLAVRGHTCAATIQITSTKHRALGVPDAIITINWEWWGNHNNGLRLAMLDHELTHIEVELDGEGVGKRDDVDRPKLLTRYHDWEFGGFLSIVQRHGINAVEALSVKQVATSETFTQKRLFCAEDFDFEETLPFEGKRRRNK